MIGYRDVPGKPAIYGTTKTFLDHFNLKNLSELPSLAELKDLESQEAKLQVQLELTEIPENAEVAADETATTEINAAVETEQAAHETTEIEQATEKTLTEELTEQLDSDAEQIAEHITEETPSEHHDDMTQEEVSSETSTSMMDAEPITHE